MQPDFSWGLMELPTRGGRRHVTSEGFGIAMMRLSDRVEGHTLSARDRRAPIVAKTRRRYQNSGRRSRLACMTNNS
jgi:hypothetical protein